MDYLPHPDAEEAKVHVVFDVRPVKDEARSLQEGRPVFTDTDYVRIQIPGDKSSIIHRAVTEADKARFPRAYAAWKANQATPATGTPLAEWAAISRSECEELQHFGCRTVEQLAGMSDGNARNVGPILRLRDKAKAFVAEARESAPLQRVSVELAEKDARIALLERQLQEQAADIRALRTSVQSGTPYTAPAPVEVATKRKPGRPRKTPQAEG